MDKINLMGEMIFERCVIGEHFLPLVPAGVLAHSTKASEPGNVRELGFIGEAGGHLLGRQVLRLPEDRAQTGIHLHNPFRSVTPVNMIKQTRSSFEIQNDYLMSNALYCHLYSECFVWCRVDSCCVHSRRHFSVWGKFSP